LLDSADYAADTSITDIAAAAILQLFSARHAVTHGCLGGTLMKRTLLVLALALLTAAGCRVVGSNSNCNCGQSCGDAYPYDMPQPVPAHDVYSEAYGAQYAEPSVEQYDESFAEPYTEPYAGQPYAEAYGEPCGESCGPGCGAECGGACGGNIANCAEHSALCQGGNCCCGLFDRYRGCGCGGAGCNECGCGSGAPGPYDCSACNSPGWGCPGYGYGSGHGFGKCRGLCHGAGAILRNGYCCCCGAPAPGCCCNSGDSRYNFMPGPPIGQTAYPYYTLRGPRDFLLNNPPKLGPY
jgi:hypothetical protein